MILKKPKASFPDLTSEASLGFFASQALIIGVDEVGRGCLAGPVVAGAAAISLDEVLKLGFSLQGARPKGDSEHPLLKVKDSKLIAESDRAPLGRALEPYLMGFQVEEASVDEIAELNILYASQLAMVRAVETLEKRLGRKADAVLIDGNLVPMALKDRGHALVKGDLRALTIACGSVFAKVYRDELMEQLELKYPGYGLKKHKGYPTPFHKAQILALGSTPIHRRGFKGVQ